MSKVNKVSLHKNGVELGGDKNDKTGFIPIVTVYAFPKGVEISVWNEEGDNIRLNTDKESIVAFAKAILEVWDNGN